MNSDDSSTDKSRLIRKLQGQAVGLQILMTPDVNSAKIQPFYVQVGDPFFVFS